jgi:aldehyde oxidoreductase
MLNKRITVNGVSRHIIADGDTMLSTVLREDLGLTGTKIGCGKGVCGACSVLIDGKVTRSCITKMSRIKDGSEITTIEGIGIPKNMHPIQVAWIVHGGAQCGFCSPGFIVSTKALLEENPDPSREEVRDWFQKHKNVCRCTGYKPLVDAVMDAASVMRGEKTVADLAFKIPKSGRIWGSRMPRPSAVAKVTGTLDFGADLGVKMPKDTLYCKAVMSEVSHANIKNIDISEAEKMPGVVKVVTHKDVKGKNRVNGLAMAGNKGDGWDRPILNDEKVFQCGDVLAIVCADTHYNAERAAEKVKLDLEQLPEYMSAPAAMADDAIEIHPGTPNVYFEQKIEKGPDTKDVFDKADVVIEGDYYTSRQPHLPLEPDVGFAYIDDEGGLVIHSKSVGLQLHAAMIADGLGVELDKLHMVQNPTGGTFGYKFSPTMEAMVGACAMATGRPCFLGFNYEEHQHNTGKRSPFWTHIRYAAQKDGKLLGMETDWSVDHGPYSEFGDLLTIRGAQYIGSGYDWASIRGIGRTVCTNHCYGAAFRGYGSTESEFPSEVLMDELAEKLDMDPFDLRYKNIYRKGCTTPTGQEPEVYSLEEMFDKMRPKYEEAKRVAAAGSTDEVKRAVGIALGVYAAGLDGPDTSEADAELMSDGTVTIYDCWQDHGQGADSGTLGTAHETLLPLGIRPDQINLVMNDTRLAPAAGPSGGSRSQVMTGHAIVDACEQLLAAMKKDDGSFRTYDEMVKDGKKLRYNGKWTAPCNPCDEKGQGNPFCCYMYGLFLSSVAVEVATGKTTVEKMICVTDVGKINNFLVVDGQIYGGMAQGVGLALYEDYEDLKKHASMRGAGIPYAKQIPDDMEIIYVETPRPDGPHGASGVGEMPLTAPHCAIVNGIYQAVGARIRAIPATPEKVLAAMK